jgi:hypothetical protein
MRLVWPFLLAFTSGIAHADGAWSEYGAGIALRPAEQLTESSCEIEVTLHGAIASVEQRVKLSNPGGDALAATGVLTLPQGAQLVGLEVKHGGRKAESAIAVSRAFGSDPISDPMVLGADPAMLHALRPLDGRPRFRLLLQPIAREHESVITTRWTRTADIRAGALHLALPAREGKPCRGSVHAQPGPGTSVARVRVDRQEVQLPSFTLADKELALDVDLAFKRNEPVVWTQTESLGDGWTAQAITVLAPPGRATGAKRVLFLVDGSRSMELVGRHRVKQLVRALAGMLTRGTEVEAIIYDRSAARVLGAWQPIDAKQLAAIETAIDTHTPGNGSDAVAALALAKKALTDLRGETQIVLVTDGVMGDLPSDALSKAIEPAQIGLHAVVLSRGRMSVPDAEPVLAAINREGGSYRTLDVEELDSALASLDDWLRPSWLQLALSDLATGVPTELRAGSGVVLTRIAKRHPKPILTGKSDKPIKIAAVPAATAPIAELALDHAWKSTEVTDQADAPALKLLRARHPAADSERAFVVLSTAGKIAANRRAVTASGGPYTRVIALTDPTFAADPAPAPPKVGGSAIDRVALELLFRTQLQPAAFACYQRALAKEAKLAGTATFKLEIGRGETTRAQVTGITDATFSACLLDAAYKVTPSLPNPDYNTDDRTVANYPLTFSVREDKPFVIAGDADSSSPLDIDAIQGGVPVKLKPSDVDSPLGNLRPPKSP